MKGQWWARRTRRTKILLAAAMTTAMVVAIAAVYGPFDITEFATKSGLCGTWACDQEVENAYSSKFFQTLNANPAIWTSGTHPVPSDYIRIQFTNGVIIQFKLTLGQCPYGNKGACIYPSDPWDNSYQPKQVSSTDPGGPMKNLGSDCVGGYYVTTFDAGYWATSYSYPDPTTVEITGFWEDTGPVAFPSRNEHCVPH